MPQMDTIDNELSSVIDLTAMILVNLKNDPTPPSSPILSTPLQLHAVRSGSPCLPSSLKTELCDCMLCTRAAPLILSKCHTWAWIMRVVFYSLRDRYPEKKFFSLKNDVYEYMMNHWGILGLDRKPSANWHKQIQDMLSHSRNIFESGMAHFKQNGFWRLKDLEDPWTARPDIPRPPSTSPPPTPALLPSSPRKRGWKNAQDETEIDQEEAEVVHTTLKKLCTPPTSPRLSLTASQDSLLSLSSSSSSIPSSPLQSPRQYISSPLSKTCDDLEKEVAILREQLDHIAHLSSSPIPSDSPSFSPSSPIPFAGPSPTSSSIPPNPQQQFAVFSHNRVWEDSYSFHPIGSVVA